MTCGLLALPVVLDWAKLGPAQTSAAARHNTKLRISRSPLLHFCHVSPLPETDSRHKMKITFLGEKHRRAFGYQTRMPSSQESCAGNDAAALPDIRHNSR